VSAVGEADDTVLSEYTNSYYEAIQGGSRRSAEVVVPLVLGLLPARRIVDVGCGVGNWLAVFREHGAEEILGIDGDHVERSQLQVPAEYFRAFDLSKSFSTDRTFDLAVSLEVAEHLPAESAETFVQSLTRLAPAVLFSAAIPFQGGNRHLNEQWPDEWARLFERHDYLAIDCVRKRVWENASVDWWYAQNTLLYAKAELFESNDALKGEYERSSLGQLRLVHPRQYLHLHGLYQEAAAMPHLKAATQTFVASLKNSVRWRLGRKSNGRQGQAEVSAARRLRNGV
jgi:SAM-dependent methyltransferase